MGGPLAFVQTGDLIEIDVAERRLDLLVDDAEMAHRRANWTPPVSKFSRGYTHMYLDHVTQANEGCDFDYLEYSEIPTPEPEIH